MDTEAPTDTARPYASWLSVVSGLIALGFALYILLSGDLLVMLDTSPKDEPLLMASLVQGIIGTLAGVVALARKEPKRLALIGLSASFVAVVAKFFLAALAAALVIAVIIAILFAVGG